MADLAINAPLFPEGEVDGDWRVVFRHFSDSGLKVLNKFYLELLNLIGFKDI